MLLTDFSERKYRKLLRKEAQEEGREKGREEGEERINDLNRRLIEDNRQEDFRRSLVDRDYQEQLLKEYGI